MLNRRSFLAALPAAAVLARQALAEPTLSRQRAFIGTTGKDSQGIFTAEFDPGTGSFAQPEFAAKLMNTDFLAVSPKNRKRLYSSCLVDGSAAVTAFDIVDGPEPLKQINQQTAKGTSAVYVALDPTGRTLLEANWGSGSINTYAIGADGGLSPAVEHIEYGDADKGPVQPQQVHSRAHSIVTSPDGRFVLVNDYGTDRINIYRLDAGTSKLTPNDPPFWKSAPGTAPRHVVWHPNGRWLYSNNELSNTVDLLLWDKAKGTLKLQSSLSTLPADAPPKCRTADLLLSPDAKFLYGSNRGLESFVAWSVQKDGGLKQIQFVKQAGAENRQICLDATGKWFIGANQRSGDLVVYPRDGKTGMLGDPKSSVKLPGACFTLFA